uniref:Putative iron-sulfur cluster-binding domain contining protein n=1 Tax=viral metagenome TaxID=1070528 RepID=A0A6H1ZTL0_9ZZZZ
MKAQFKSRLNLDNRVRLETVLPLRTPYLVYLDPSDLCNFKCSYCPTGNRELVDKYRKSQLMDYDLYRKIIDDLCTMPDPIRTLRLYKNGEPLMNPRFANMVEYAKNSGRFLKVDTTTNGSLLWPSQNVKLIEAGLDAIFISVPGDYGTKYVENVRNLYEMGRGLCQINVKIISTKDTTEDVKQKFLDDFGNISDQIFIENLAECWPEYEILEVNKTVGLFGQELKDIKVCSYIFYSLVINSNGTVSLCCQDWKHKLIIGDLKTEKFKDIWNGRKLKDYQMSHLEGLRWLIPVCGDCGQLLYGEPDNIDEFRKEILRRIQ